VGAETFHAKRRTDTQTDMTKLVVAFHSFAKLPIRLWRFCVRPSVISFTQSTGVDLHDARTRAISDNFNRSQTAATLHEVPVTVRSVTVRQVAVKCKYDLVLGILRKIFSDMWELLPSVQNILSTACYKKRELYNMHSPVQVQTGLAADCCQCRRVKWNSE